MKIKMAIGYYLGSAGAAALVSALQHAHSIARVILAPEAQLVPSSPVTGEGGEVEACALGQRV